MSEFKYICNFGVDLDSYKILRNGYKLDINSLQKELMKIPTF